MPDTHATSPHAPHRVLSRRSPRPLVGLAGLLSLLWLGGPARAADQIVGIRSLAMGDSLRAAATGAEGVLLNPSGIALLKQYVITGFYDLKLQSLGHGVHVSIVDSVTQAKVAMGLYYNFIYETPNVGYTISEGGANPRMFNSRDPRLLQSGPWQPNLTRIGHEVGVVTAFPLGDRFSLGITTKYGWYSTTAQLPTPSTAPAGQPPNSPLPANFAPGNPSIDQNFVYDFGSLSSVVNFDIGVTVKIAGGLSVGVVGQNLWGHSDEQPTMLGTGLAYVASTRLTLAADATVNFTGNQNCVAVPPAAPCSQTSDRTTVRTGGGLEYAIADRVPLRAGYLYDSNLGSHSITAGLGFFTQSFGLDFGMRERLAGGAETVLLLGFRIFRD